ncbi:hypothetical protein ONS95_005124 [Cadophora gregata]|uniref:uncharacterized protein n=1 Tax=Cadophora gregata TaxID=51156 RepID=UPI0026DB2F92|nr:uncharacterized protein ONS95_005124 [Cadophora gregata]KAK0104858.1 hypothetical protein ONS95_005124 [Cadophora gregata]KAK0115063.1 hypothetical protein ONS96_013533 [Cadophora gregata f. sp. sojae]
MYQNSVEEIFVTFMTCLFLYDMIYGSHSLNFAEPRLSTILCPPKDIEELVLKDAQLEGSNVLNHVSIGSDSGQMAPIIGSFHRVAFSKSMPAIENWSFSNGSASAIPVV